MTAPVDILLDIKLSKVDGFSVLREEPVQLVGRYWLSTNASPPASTASPEPAT